MSNNPLIKQSSLEDMAKHYAEQCQQADSNVYELLLSACFQSKAQGIDECINLIDSMIHTNTKHLMPNELSMLTRTLDNLRTSLAHQRAILIQNYDEKV